MFFSIFLPCKALQGVDFKNMFGKSDLFYDIWNHYQTKPSEL